MMEGIASTNARFGQGPFLESHGGSTYCALASLALLGKMNDIPDRPLLLHWLVSRQTASGGIQGRIGKPADTCYGKRWKV